MNAPMTGEMLRDAGIAHVMAGEDSWLITLERLFDRFLDVAPITFTWQDFREYAEAQGIGQPHHPNAWSASVKRFRRRVEMVGVTNSTRPAAHARLIRVYRRAM
jgi:hypothetical protein